MGGAQSCEADVQPPGPIDTELELGDLARVHPDDDDSALPPNVNDESRYIFAEDVVGLSLQYFDGTNWTDTWDGSTLGADGKTPIGPPRLVQITLAADERSTWSPRSGGRQETIVECFAVELRDELRRVRSCLVATAMLCRDNLIVRSNSRVNAQQ